MESFPRKHSCALWQRYSINTLMNIYTRKKCDMLKQFSLIFVFIKLLEFMHYILLCSSLSFAILSKRGMECNLEQVLQIVMVFSAANQ